MAKINLDHYLNDFAKKMFEGDYVKHALATRQVSADYVVEQLRIGLKEALGKWIVEAWEKDNERA